MCAHKAVMAPYRRKYAPTNSNFGIKAVVIAREIETLNAVDS